MEASMQTNLLKTLGDDTRLRILRLLLIQPFCVTEIMHLLDLTQTNTSKQLGKLKKVGVIETHRKDGFTYYLWSTRFQSEEAEWTKAITKMLNASPNFSVDRERTKTYLDGNYSCKDLMADNTLLRQLEEFK
jgi:ArsR family transcriptional regulator